MSAEELRTRWKIKYADLEQRFKPQAYYWEKGRSPLKIPSWPLCLSTHYKRAEIIKIEGQNPSIRRSPGSPAARKAIQKYFEYISAENLASRWGIHYSVLGQLNLTAYLLPDYIDKRWGMGLIPMVYYPQTYKEFQKAFYFFPDIEKYEDDHPEKHQPPCKLTPCQEDKKACQKIATETWAKYPTLGIIHMMRHPDILKIVGKQYKGRSTLRNWLKGIAPDQTKKPGRRGAKVQAQQRKICKEIGIKI